jgi:1-phosphofructokinase family hexose kinase
MSRPILVAGANISLDRTNVVGALNPGHIHRARQTDVRGGGKGVNVARALSCIGRRAVVVGFRAGHVGRAVAALLEQEGIELVGIPCEGETRSCLTVLSDDAVTVFNEPGCVVGASAWQAFEAAVQVHLEPGSVFVCSGSFPPGAPLDAAARLIGMARAAGCLSICDTSGAHLRAALEAAPDAVTPNLAEALALLDYGASERAAESDGALQRAAAAAVALTSLGPRGVVVTAGAAGAVVVEGGEVTALGAPRVQSLNPVGAGDCLVAGLADRIGRGASLVDAARWGAALAAASCENLPAAVLDLERARELLEARPAEHVAARHEDGGGR